MAGLVNKAPALRTGNPLGAKSCVYPRAYRAFRALPAAATLSLSKTGRGQAKLGFSQYGRSELLAGTRSWRKFVGRDTWRISAKSDDDTSPVGVALSLGKGAVGGLAKLVPESVPRPVAKAGVVFGLFLIFLFVFKSIFNTILTLLTLGAVGLTLLAISKDGGDDSDEGGDDSLQAARRIMDKYK